jgi:hypothetical protein
MIDQKLYDGPEHKKTLGQLRDESRNRSDSERKARYFMLPQTQRNHLRFLAYEKIVLDGAFLCACENAKVKPTHRQAAKWSRHEGAAWNAR